jgi:MOSC domain-containing protein YiiM
MAVATVDSVNAGVAEPNPHKTAVATGINKRALAGPAEVRAPGSKHAGSGSGIVGDFIGDRRNHGGDSQALYAFEREDLDVWQERLERHLPNGFFGENLTTRDLDVNGARLGEVWSIGDRVRVRVTGPRIPCSTFRGWVGETGWLKTFTAVARPGAYLSIVSPGAIAAGDVVTIVERPPHDVTIALVYRAMTTERDLLPQLLEARDYLDQETLDLIAKGETLHLG